MKAIMFLFLAAIVLFAGTCDYYDNRLQIINGSRDVITVDYSEDTILEMRANENIRYFIRDKAFPGDTIRKNIPGSQHGWQSIIQRSVNGKLNLFFINVDTLLKYNNWEYIKENKLYKRREFSIDELEELNWAVYYND
jgi:hypothetical protein